MAIELQDHSSHEASTKTAERRRQTGASCSMTRNIFSIFSIGLLGISSAPIFLIQQFAVGRGVARLDSCRDTESICRTLACRVFDWSEIIASEEVLPHWAQQPSQATFVFSLISATTLLSISRELTSRDRAQTVLLSLSIPVICAIGAVAGMWTLVEVICFFPQSVALALALSFVFQAQGVSAEEAVAFRGKE